VPSSFSAGTGTIVGGTGAGEATAAAAKRVVRLSDGQHNVHMIAVNAVRAAHAGGRMTV
jgi:hypothetical protein